MIPEFPEDFLSLEVNIGQRDEVAEQQKSFLEQTFVHLGSISSVCVCVVNIGYFCPQHD